MNNMGIRKERIIDGMNVINRVKISPGMRWKNKGKFIAYVQNVEVGQIFQLKSHSHSDDWYWLINKKNGTINFLVSFNELENRFKLTPHQNEKTRTTWAKLASEENSFR